jgi:hypothetical protein
MESEPDLTRKNRLWFAGLTLVFCAGLVLWTTLCGVPSNSLHASAQAWAFGIIAAILAGFGFGAVAPSLAGLKK